MRADITQCLDLASNHTLMMPPPSCQMEGIALVMVEAGITTLTNAYVQATAAWVHTLMQLCDRVEFERTQYVCEAGVGYCTTNMEWPTEALRTAVLSEPKTGYRYVLDSNVNEKYRVGRKHDRNVKEEPEQDDRPDHGVAELVVTSVDARALQPGFLIAW